MIVIDTIGFKLNMCNNNLQLKKKTNSFDRIIYAKYLIHKRKSNKNLKLNRLIKYFNESVDDIDNTCTKLQNNIYEYNNKNANIKEIIIGNNIHIDVKNVKHVMISTNDDNITIELDKSYKNIINNDISLLSKNIKELDTLLNLLDIFLNIIK